MTRHLFNVSGDPEVADLQVAALLISLTEQHGTLLGPTTVFALQYAARRLCESWFDKEEDDEEDDPDDGPLALDSLGDKTRPGSLGAGVERTEIMFG